MPDTLVNDAKEYIRQSGQDPDRVPAQQVARVAHLLSLQPDLRPSYRNGGMQGVGELVDSVPEAQPVAPSRNRVASNDTEVTNVLPEVPSREVEPMVSAPVPVAAQDQSWLDEALMVGGGAAAGAALAKFAGARMPNVTRAAQEVTPSAPVPQLPPPNNRNVPARYQEPDVAEGEKIIDAEFEDVKPPIATPVEPYASAAQRQVSGPQQMQQVEAEPIAGQIAKQPGARDTRTVTQNPAVVGEFDLGGHRYRATVENSKAGSYYDIIDEYGEPPPPAAQATLSDFLESGRTSSTADDPFVFIPREAGVRRDTRASRAAREKALQERALREEISRRSQRRSKSSGSASQQRSQRNPRRGRDE